MASYGDDDAAADGAVTLSATVYTLRREVEEVSLEKIQLLSQLRLQEHDVRDARSEAARLTELIESVQAQHQERVGGLLEEREKLLKRCRIAEDTAAFCEQALAEANGEVEASLAERETLAKVANGLMKDKEERLLELHLSQDKCDELQGKHDKLETEREHDLEEIAALRRNVEFNDQYIKNLHESRQRLDEHARRLQAELQEVVLRCDGGAGGGGGVGGASALAAMDFSQPLSSLPPPMQQQQQQQQQPQSSLPMDGAFDPLLQPPQGHDPAYYDGQQESMYPRGGGGGGGGYDDGYGGADEGGAFVRDPMSPARLLRADEDAAYARQSDEYPQEEAASPRNREYEEEMGRLGMKLERLCTDVHTTRVEDQYVQTEYMIEASTRLNGALAALEQLCAIIADWKASISCGREPWGSLESKEQELTARRLRDIERRAAMKKEVTRTLERTGMGDDVVACLEVHFASGRVRDAVTYAVEGFQASKEAADTCMAHAKRTIEESVEAARAQAELIGLSKGDAGQMDEKLKELTNTKFQAENEVESLKRQVEERDAYQKEVERLSGLMKQEAQDDRQKMSQIAMDMTEKQQAELMKMGDVHRKEVAEMTRTHVAKVESLHAGHTEDLARLSAEVQQHKDAAEAMRKVLDDKDRQLEGEVAKKKTAKNAKEQMSAELSGLKQVMSMMGRENKEVKGMVKAVEKENLVLKELSTKLESDVRRGRIMMEGENTRSAFEAWRSSRAGGDSGSPHGTLPPPAPSSRAESHSQMRSRSQAMYPNPDKKSRTRDYTYYNASSPPQALKPTSLRPYIGPV